MVRARVRSRAGSSYDEAQAAIDDGTADEVLVLLAEVGELRLHREAAARRASRCRCPSRRSTSATAAGTSSSARCCRSSSWNAQISLLTGFAAASLMVYARVGLLRTLPPPDPRDLQRLHRTARALGIEWPAEQLYPDFIRALDPTIPAHAAMVVACTRLLRGSGYVGFNGEVPAQPQHAALVSEYAHVTAPLRRLGDRYAGEICVALCAGTEVPGLGARPAGRAARHPARLGPARAPLRAGGARPGRGGHARRPRRRHLRRRGGRPSTRTTSRRGVVTCARRASRPRCGSEAPPLGTTVGARR